MSLIIREMQVKKSYWDTTTNLLQHLKFKTDWTYLVVQWLKITYNAGDMC